MSSVEVVAAVLQDDQGRYLLTRRPAGKVRAGEWEFPGGKLDADETAHEALRRELHEELGIELLTSEPLHSFHHQYPDVSVRIQVCRVLRWRGQPRSCEQQQLGWFDHAGLAHTLLSAADGHIARLLRLPPLLYITPSMRATDQRQDLLAGVRKALLLGAGLVYFRQTGLAAGQLMDWLEQVAALCHAHAAGVLCNREFLDLPVTRSTALPVDGIHLRAAELPAAGTDRRLLDWRLQHPQALLGASCHAAEELLLASQADCSHALIGPVRPTASHPQRPALGWQTVCSLAAQTDLPLYALGGLQPADLDQARANGAYGIAAIRGFASA